MNVLFLQQKPCNRNSKIAQGLKECGHSVSLGYFYPDPSIKNRLWDGIYDHKALLSSTPRTQILKLAQGCEICHVHNEPDTWTRIAIEMLADKMPIIHDTHDLISLRGSLAGRQSDERYAHTNADGLVFVSNYQLQQSRRLYGDEKPAMVLWSAINAADVPTERLPKLSEQDGAIHIVYQGGCNTRIYRDHRELFAGIVKAGFHLHIHSAFAGAEYRKLAERYDNMHFYPPMHRRELFPLLTRYDIGLIPLNIDESTRECGQACMPNKLFEYIAAGLPILARNLTALREFITERRCGFLYDSIADIVAIPRDDIMSARTTDLITMEDNIPALVAFYRGLL